jgi:hypothetical protein
MHIVYYYKHNSAIYCKNIKCSLKNLNEKLLSIKETIESLHLSILKKNDLSDSTLKNKIYEYYKYNGLFYITQNKPSNIKIKTETKLHINNLIR